MNIGGVSSLPREKNYSVENPPHMVTYTLLDFINHVDGLDAAVQFVDVDVLVELGTGAQKWKLQHSRYSLKPDEGMRSIYTLEGPGITPVYIGLQMATRSDAVNVFGRRLKRILLYARITPR